MAKKAVAPKMAKSAKAATIKAGGKKITAKARSASAGC
jgi:hypothetical protein